MAYDCSLVFDTFGAGAPAGQVMKTSHLIAPALSSLMTGVGGMGGKGIKMLKPEAQHPLSLSRLANSPASSG